MSSNEIWIDSVEIDAALDRMSDELRRLIKTRGFEDPLMVGIHTGGVWIAERLHRAIGLKDALGALDISFYRDDFTRIGINPEVRPSQLPEALDGRHVVLVDDVLQTGRTIRAALNELFDYGRPASVVLAVLAERGGRELPIEPDVAGLALDLADDRHIKLIGPAPLRLMLDRARPQTDNTGETP